ncbi:MAG: YitT family protein [Flavobacteriales bacterium]|nr:YitT family protein [Flavobacteriales bacterium]MCB9363502.1 YitT family protein [Flavobacteriales bacterium]
MRDFLKKIVVRSTFKKALKLEKSKELSDYVLAKGYRKLKINTKRTVKDFFLITIGIFLAAFGFKGFLLTNHFIDGGATGISLLISALTEIPLHYLIIVVNAPFIFLAYSIMGRKFAVKTVLAITGLAICLATVTFPNVTNDNLLVSIFGGFFLGAGIGFAVRGGAVIDGTEVLAIFVSRKVGATVGDVIIVINIMIFSAAAYLLGVEIALYSMITYIAASKTLDFIIEGIEEYIGVTIVSPHSDEIKRMIIHDIGRGVTIYKGERGFGKTGESQEMDIVYSVITRLDINKLNTEVQKIDPNAFVVMHSVKDIKGGMIKRRPLH